MQTDTATLRERVLAATRSSPIADEIGDVEVEADRHDDTDVLRVMVHVIHPGRASDEQLDALIDAIEDQLSGIDERYPSVRFLEND